MSFSPEIRYDKKELPALSRALGPAGIGAYVIAQAVSEHDLRILQAEAAKVTWRDNHSTYVNSRGLLIDQRHDVCAYRLKVGNPDAVPGFMKQTAGSISGFVRSFDDEFPALQAWDADEISMHRYDDPEVGLSRHRDNVQFWGVVAVLTIEGMSDFVVYKNDEMYVLSVGPGDLVLMRATYLIDQNPDKAHQAAMNPEHAVVNVRVLPRTAVIVRDNLEPDAQVKGFSYDNWQPSS